MIQKLKMMFLSFGATLMFALPFGISGMAYAADANIDKSLCKGANLELGDPTKAGTSKDCTDPKAGVNLTNLIKTIINVLSIIIGAIAVIMIIIGGFRYVTSAGNDSSVAAAKNTILYALIGLIIVALAQIVVQFVLNSVNRG